MMTDKDIEQLAENIRKIEYQDSDRAKKIARCVKRISMLRVEEQKVIEELRELTGARTPDDENIDTLRLSTHARKTLERANINTISGILAYPRGQFKDIRCLGKKAAMEIVEAMHEKGYTDFEIIGITAKE